MVLVQSLGGEDPPGEGTATHSGILAWRIPMDRGARWLQSMRLQSHMTEATAHTCARTKEA